MGVRIPAIKPLPSGDMIFDLQLTPETKALQQTLKKYQSQTAAKKLVMGEAVKVADALGMALMLRMRANITGQGAGWRVGNLKQISTTSALLRRTERFGARALSDTGKLASVLSWNARMSGDRIFIEAGPLGPTKSTLRMGVAVADQSERPHKLPGALGGGLLTYGDLAWVHELGYRSKVTPKMMRFFMALAKPPSDVTVRGESRPRESVDEYTREGARKWLKGVTGYSYADLKRMDAESWKEGGPANVSEQLGAGKVITVEKRPFMHPAMDGAFAEFNVRFPHLAKAIFQRWTTHTGPKAFLGPDAVTFGKLSEVLKDARDLTGAAAAELGKMVTLGSRPRGFGVYGTLGNVSRTSLHTAFSKEK